MALTNSHGIRHKAKGGGKKWRPSPNDPVLAQPQARLITTKWTNSIRDLFRKGPR